VRIIGGTLRGSKLAIPAVEGLRPTPDRQRETLFNWLMPIIDGSRCLDLFAGSGALGIEAASRGAREVVLVERDPRAAAALRDSLARLKVDSARLLEGDAMRYLQQQPPTPFDIVFLDPPFADELCPAAAQALSRGWLAPGAWVYVESAVDAPPAIPAHWPLWRESRSGAVRGALYRPGEAP
jgi:16S rRNA (guanine966-N2)-methyltransferase